MKSRLSGACLVVLGLGCAPTESVAEARLAAHASTITTQKTARAFPALSWGELEPVEAGVFRGRVSFGQHGFLTMERTLFNSIDGRWELELSSDGQARACFAGKRKHGGSVSRYASEDGKDHHNEYEESWTLALGGSWTATGHADGRAELLFDRSRYGSCALDERSGPLLEPLPWSCWRMQSPRGATGAATACRVPLVQLPSAVGYTALAVANTSRDGSWEMREDITHRGEPAFDEGARPWLLAGESEGEGGGLVVHSRDEGRGRGAGEVVLRLQNENLDALRVEP